jgi:hypothetical protein
MIYHIGVPDIAFNEFQAIVVRQIFTLARGQVIQNSHACAIRQQPISQVGSDKPCASCY